MPTHVSRWMQRSLLAAAVCACALNAVPSWAQDLRIALYADATGFDPHDTSDTLSYSVQSGIFERLFQFDREMKVIPVLATGYEANDDATEFTITLRQGVEFSDATPFNAAAAKANLDRLADQSLGLKRNSLFSMVDRVEILDDYRIKVVLKRPFGAMINTLAHPSAVMISPKALADHPSEDELRRNPVGTGPFEFAGWEPGRQIKLVKNPQYWKEGWPKVDSVVFYPTPEASTRVARLQAGEVDAVYPLPAELTQVVERNPKLGIARDPGIMQYFLAINNLKPALDDVRVRQAFNHAIDSRVWLRAVFGDMGTVATAPIADGVGFYAAQPEYAYDPDLARELLRQAGHADGLDLQLWTSNETSDVRAAQIFKQQLGQVGVRVSVVPMDAGARNERLWGNKDPESAQYDLYYGGWSPSTGEADWALRPVYATESWTPTSYNVAYYSNPEVDQDIQAALETADDEVRAAHYAKAQAQIWQDAPRVFLGNPDNVVGLTKGLNEVYMLADRSLVFDQANFE
ncbi:glutathione ABC transporter substrate-binding protein [Halotalea alkalilenta]|uniref:glutathione ABC transporter substrate-binding protein n=1 Tax=Halotalea alkalilenta TaxID=376489 RepID=UPI000488C704|nr:glutathione ABC transporter substrate-binding protein [Halotalea alkalilenta]